MSSLKLEDALRRSQEMFADNIACVEKHKVADSYFNVVKADKPSFSEKGITATIMNNFARVCDAFDASSAGRNLQSDFGPYVMELWPLVTAWYAEFPLKDLISVQSMDKPLGYLFFSKLLVGTNKSEQVIGDVVETPLGQRTIKGKYPTGEIFGEVIPAAQVDTTQTPHRALLAYAPLNTDNLPGYLDKTMVTFEDTTGTTLSYRALSVTGGKIKFYLSTDATKAEVSGLELDVTTGLLTYNPTVISSTITSLKEIKANYVWNLDFAEVDNIQKVKEVIEMVPMEAVPRALALEWTIFSEYLKKTQFGQDIRNDNIQRILSLMYQYQVRYILDEMYDYAGVRTAPGTALPYEVKIPTSGVMSLDVKAQTVMATLKNIANVIEINSGRIEGNRIVCGKNFKSFCESLPNTWFTPSDSAMNYGFSTPREIGQFGTFKVYYDPTRKEDEAFMTYRGSEFYDAAYYLAEYLPITPTDAVTLATTVRSAFVSMEAYKFHKPSCVVLMKITYIP